jgi:hypothetical protein
LEDVIDLYSPPWIHGAPASKLFFARTGMVYFLVCGLVLLHTLVGFLIAPALLKS